MTGEELKSLINDTNEAARQEAVSRLLCVYEGDWMDILVDRLNGLFLKQNAEKLRKRADTSVNLMRQAAEHVPAVYTRSVHRTVDGDVAPFDVFDSLDLAFDAADKKAFVCQEVFIRPLVDERRKVIVTDILTSDHAWGLPDPVDPLGLSLLVYRQGSDYVLWTPEFYAIYNENFDLQVNPDNPDNANPFGFVPWVAIHNSYPSDGRLFHEARSEQLYQATLAVAVQKTDLNHVQHLQSYKQLFGAGLDDEEKTKMMSDPSVMLTVDNPSARVSVLDMQANVKGMLEAILEGASATLNQLGIRPETTRGTLSAQSGYALRIQLHNLEREWEKRRTLWRLYEQRYYNIARLMWEFITGSTLPEGNVLVEYAPLGPGANFSEEVATWNAAVSGKLASRKRAMQALWNLSDEEYQKEIQVIQEEEVALAAPILPLLGGDPGLEEDDV